MRESGDEAGGEARGSRWLVRCRTGMTLLEVVAVVGVVAILAAFLLPVVARAREQARASRCLSQLHQLGQAHALYLQDWDERFPAWRQVVPKGVPRATDEGWESNYGVAPRRFCLWTESLAPYLGREAILYDGGVPLEPSSAAAWGADYALATWGAGGHGSVEAPYYHWPEPALRLSQVRRPTETILFADGQTTTFQTQILPGRHGDGINAAFVDGRAAWLPRAAFLRADQDAQGFHWFRYGTVDR